MDENKISAITLNYEEIGMLDRLSEIYTDYDVLKKYLLRFIRTINPKLGVCFKIKCSDHVNLYLGVDEIMYEDGDLAPIGARVFHHIYQLGGSANRRSSSGKIEICNPVYLRVDGSVRVKENENPEYLSVTSLACARSKSPDGEYEWRTQFFEGGVVYYSEIDHWGLAIINALAKNWWHHQDIDQTYT